MIGSEEVRERIKRLEVSEKIDSDHHPLEVVLKGEKIRNRCSRGKGRGVLRGRGDEEIVRREIGAISLGEGGTQEEWEKMEEKVKLAMGITKKERGERKDGRMRSTRKRSEEEAEGMEEGREWRMGV